MTRRPHRIELDPSAPIESLRALLGMTYTELGDAIGATRQGASQLAGRGDAVMLSTLRERLRSAGFDIEIAAVRAKERRDG